MKGNGRVSEALNDLLTLELTVVNQYFLHSRMCENWGFRRLAKRFRDIAFEEMKDAERIIDRILSPALRATAECLKPTPSLFSAPRDWSLTRPGTTG